MILAGDIGGTKTNLALFEHRDNTLHVRAQHQYFSREFSTLDEVITLFKEKTSMPHIDAACFGIAGPVIEGRCRTTNLPWDITTTDLQQYLGIRKVRLLNDLEATAYGMLYLSEDEFVDLNPKGRNIDGNRAVIAAGTGLGAEVIGNFLFYFLGHKNDKKKYYKKKQINKHRQKFTFQRDQPLSCLILQLERLPFYL